VVADDIRYLLVPGRGIPGPGHWLRRWAGARPDFRWAPEPPGPPFDLAKRVKALHDAISADAAPAMLIAHSAGCITVATWASRHRGPVRAALLATPPFLPPDWTPGPDDPPDLVSFAVPRERLPFPTILVASRTDPYTTFEQFEQYAEDWGSELVDAGDAGHLGTASGYGPWPAGERLVETLVKR
jgi:predicted alpha/beta hydrolase family esterase